MKLRMAAFAAAGAFGAIVSPQQAAAFDPPYVWVGKAVIDTRTAACQEAFKLGVYDSAFRPKLEPGEKNPAISFTTQFFGAIFQRAGPANQVAHRLMQTPGNWEGHHFGFKTVVSNPKQPNGKTPPNSTGTYEFNISDNVPYYSEGDFMLQIDPGRITYGSGFLKGCTFTFHAAYNRVPGVFDPDITESTRKGSRTRPKGVRR